MATDKQIEANRRNSEKSTGPCTETGKNRSRLNATRHGLTGQVSVMTEEDRVAQEAFTKPIIEGFHPATAYETQLAQAIATCHWRLNRAAALEENILTLGLTADTQSAHQDFEHPQINTALTQAAAYRDDPKAFERLSLYANRLLNQAGKLTKELKQLQAERKAEEKIALDEAATLYKFHEMQQVPFDPAENGFVLSVPEIRAYVHRETTRDQATTAAFVHFVPKDYANYYRKAA